MESANIDSVGLRELGDCIGLILQQDIVSMDNYNNNTMYVCNCDIVYLYTLTRIISINRAIQQISIILYSV